MIPNDPPTAGRRHIVVLTGAGISAESGLQTFRDGDGLWENYRVEDVATPEAWQRDAELVQRFYNERRRQVVAAQPNAAHRALAALEDHFRVSIITQNIDDLHERAGSSKILHLHGEILKSRSSRDPNLLYDTRGADIQMGQKCELGSQLRPHVVWFGEDVPAMQVAMHWVLNADVLLVVGTSLLVYPAASLVQYAPPNGDVFVIDPAAPSVAHPRVKSIVQTACEGVPAWVQGMVKNAV
ncbi:MAG: NAD-dependent deacylase [Planctomycetes bacterium]|nr:NAD-dependent deacylase [Planctomycetota bacterium]